jgi:hypothetical protein
MSKEEIAKHNQAALGRLHYEDLPEILKLQGDSRADTYRNRVLKEAGDELAALRCAAKQARHFLKVHHWNDNAPGRGCWDLDAAKEAYAALDAVLPYNGPDVRHRPEK